MFGFFLPQMVGRTDQPQGKEDTATGHWGLPWGAPLTSSPSLLPHPFSLPSCHLVPCSLLLPGYSTRTPMRRSSCLLECQVSPRDPLVLLRLGHSRGSQLRPGIRMLHPVAHSATLATCKVILAQLYKAGQPVELWKCVCLSSLPEQLGWSPGIHR